MSAKALCSLLILLASVGCSARSPQQTALPVSPARHRILVFGDSLALGMGASDSAHGFAFVLYRAVLRRDPGAEITNVAVSGARVDDVLHHELARAQTSAATDVWVCVGGNDVTRGTDTARFAAEYEALLAAIRRRWPAARLAVFGVPDVSRSPLFAGAANREMRALAAADNTATRSAARRQHALFVDLFALGAQVVPARDFAADNFHPSDAGHQAIADAARPVLDALFR